MLDLGTLQIGVKVDGNAAKAELNQLGSTVEQTGAKTETLASKAKTMIKAFIAAYAIQQLVKLGKAALEAYAKFEQLEGGVNKIFGKEAAQMVMDNANKAYKTAGLSANQYMETVTSFSASLISSMGGNTKEASKIADMAIRDMSDNANTFGTNMKSIQDAYQGFAKQNYTMLDNLKLGYGGTKTEMERLLADAEKLSGQKYDISNLDDVYQAIHVIQEEYNITGTTAKEASKTVEGSINSMKASWENLLTAMGTGKGLDKAINQFLTSLGTVAKNIQPIAIRIVVSLVKGIIKASPRLAAAAFELIGKLVIELGKAALELIDSGINAIKNFAQGIADSHPILSGAITALADIIKLALQPVITIIKTVMSVWKALLKLKSGKKFSISTPFSGAIQSMKDVFGKWKNILAQKAKKTFEVAKKGFATVLDGMKSIYNKWKDILSSAAKKVFTTEYKTKGKAGKAPGKRIGLREVPYDGYNAELHKGEAILTAAEVNQYKKRMESLNGVASGIVNGINAANVMSTSGATEAKIVINLGGAKVAEQIFRLNKQGKLAFEG